MTNAPDLKPCPFCGGDAKLISCMGNRLDNGPPWYETKRRVVCSASDCSGAANPAFTDADAIAAWNTRTDMTLAMLDDAEQRGREAERQVWLDALDPNICKADYMGEVKMPITAHQWDDDGNEVETTHHVMVDWTAMKEIMAMISAKAAAIRARGPAQEGAE